MENYYSVTAQFGHVGRNNAIIKTVPVKAQDGKEAAYKVRWMPRVKHNKKDAILSVQKISKDEYFDLRENISNDPYFHVSSKQEQKTLCENIQNEIIYGCGQVSKAKKQEREEKIKFTMRKNKIIISEAKSAMRNYHTTMAY